MDRETAAKLYAWKVEWQRGQLIQEAGRDAAKRISQLEKEANEKIETSLQAELKN